MYLCDFDEFHISKFHNFFFIVQFKYRLVVTTLERLMEKNMKKTEPMKKCVIVRRKKIITNNCWLRQMRQIPEISAKYGNQLMYQFFPFF